MTHILYSRGKLLAGFDKTLTLENLSEITQKDIQAVKKYLLSGRLKRIKSSQSLELLTELKNQLQAAGLDVYIKSE